MSQTAGGPARDPFALLTEEPESEFHLADYLRILAGRWRLVVLVTALATTASLANYAVTPKQYQASTLIQIERRMSVPLGRIDDAWMEMWWSSQYYPTQYRLLRSRGLAERVVTNLRLDQEPAFVGQRRAARDAELDDTAKPWSVVSLAYRVLGGLSVTPVPNTQLVEISYRSGDPQLAAKVANGLVETYIDWGIESRTSSAGTASTFYGQQIEALKQELSDKEVELQAYGKESDIVSLSPATNTTMRRLETFNQDYIGAISNRVELQVQLRALEDGSLERAADLMQDAQVVAKRTALADLEREYASKLNLFKPEWPAMVQLRSRIEQVRGELSYATSQALVREREVARARYQAALRQEQSLAAELNQAQADSRQMSSAAVGYTNLEIEIATKRQLLDELLRKQSETEVTSRLQATRESNVRVVDRALVPNSPFRPSLSRSLSAGVGGGAAAGLLLVLLLHYMDRTVKSSEEIERQLELPVLATVPDVSSSGGRGLFRRAVYGSGYGYGYGKGYGYGYGYGYGAKKRLAAVDGEAAGGGVDAAGGDLQIELLPHERPRLAVAEAYRSLRTSLLLSSAVELRTVAVTSAVPGEGKTSTAANLAIVLAQLPKRVLLVDGDLRKPRLHKIFSGSNRAGLVNYLAHMSDVDKIVFQSKVPNLWIVPSGPVPPNPSELIASGRMAEFIAWARASFDIVVFDSAPALAVTDAILLGKQTDGVVLCLRAGYVQRRDAKMCRDRLRQAEVRLLGAVLNCSRGIEGSYRDRYRGRSTDLSYGASEPPAGKVAAL